MKNKKYTFGGITFEIEAPFEPQEKNNSEAFRTERETDYLIRVIAAEDNEQTVKAERNGRIITRYLNPNFFETASVVSLLTSSEAAFVFPDHDAFILHAAYIVHEGHSVLFTAPSGTGKTTHAEFWRTERNAEIVNGDRVLVTRRDGKYYANGIYVCGTSGICKNITAPISAVVLLEQAETNIVREISPRMLFLRILCECSYDLKSRKQCEKITELVSDMINTLPVVCYGCRNHPDAIKELERVIM